MNKAHFAVVLVAVAAGFASASACGGSTVSSTGGGSSSSGSSGAASSSGASGTSGGATHTAGCPSTVPWTRTTATGPENPCPVEGQICEYGTDFEPGCNKIVRCDGGGWAVPILPPGAGKCGSSAPPPVPPSSQDCPSSPSGLDGQSACKQGGLCSYDGATCTCGHFCPSYPVGQAPCNPDAGITTNCCDTSGPATWHCFGGPKYCSSPRPYVGDPCTKEGDSCALSPPAECGQTVLECRSGKWQVGGGECPISTARAKRDITYLGAGDTARLADELLRVRLATYRYKQGDASRHLGFVIEDMPEGSPAVLASRDRVDLYGYMSMAVATIQEQERRIERLEAEIARLEADRRAR